MSSISNKSMKEKINKPKKQSREKGNEIEKDDVNNLSNNINNVNNLSINDIFRLMDLHFNKKNYMFRHLYDSYNKFLEEDVKNFIEFGDHIFTENSTPNIHYRHKFKFENIRIQEPVLENGIEPMFPSDARHYSLTYAVKLIADVSQFQDAIDIATDKITTTQVGLTDKNVPIASIPLMLRSKWCSLNTHKDIDKNECEYDAGGYFIVNGNEKVVICQDRMVDNKPLVFIKKDSGSMSHVVQVNSRSHKSTGITQIVSIKMNKAGLMTIRVPILNEINVFILMRALGIETDRDIINWTVYDEYDNDMIDLVRVSLDNCKNEKGNKIQTQQEAVDYLISKIRQLKKYNSPDKETQIKQKKEHLMILLKDMLLPHIEGGIRNKAIYLGYMIHKLLKVRLERAKTDDRDSYVNKRVDLVGDLMFELFRQQFKKMMGECKNVFETRSKDLANPLEVISYIKPNIIEQGMKTSLMTGHWIKRQGVAQVLQRLTYLMPIVFLRRIDAPSGDASSDKLTGPRNVHPSSVPFLCSVQTPESSKIGLIKHLTLISSITIMSRDQFALIKEFMLKRVINMQDFPPTKFRENTHYRVFLNGDWLGMSDDPINFEKDMTQKKLKGDFDQRHVSIIIDHDESEIRVYCDSGRLYRPVIKVKDNIVQLTKKQIETVSLNKIDSTKMITDWDEFIMKYPESIEYIDMELQPYVLVADKIKKVEEMRKIMNESVEKVDSVKTRHVDNRYDDMFFLKYTHCEFHPSLLLGELSITIPFLDRNDGPRNLFSYSQSKQAMGIYATNYRDRLDISYILYHPQKPLVTTRPNKYTNAEILPAGENAMVAIACYTGFNQEDSLIFNRSSVERGKFMSMYVKKVVDQVQKNLSTSQDDEFMKPDPNKLVGAKSGSYDKLNEHGYVPEETKISYGDVVIGKVSPNPDVDISGKPYKDQSQVHRSYAPAVVDRVYKDIKNSDGYEILKLTLRSERQPAIGDKFACYSDDTEILTTEGWITFDKLTKKHKVACLIDGDTLSYLKPTKLQVYDHDGDMYQVKSSQVDLLVTTNHRMWVKIRGGKEYKAIEANERLGKMSYYKKNVENYDIGKQKSEFIKNNKFIIPEYKDREPMKVPLDAWLEFFGIWMAEGCARKGQVFIDAHKQRVKDSLRTVCEKMKFNLKEALDKKTDNDKHRFGIYDVQIAEYLTELSVGAVNKYLPDWVWVLKPEQCQILIKGMMLGDGHQMKKTTTKRYDTSSKRLADDFQRLCLHAGYAANIYLKYEAGHESIIKNGDRKGEIIKSTADAYRITIVETQVCPLVNKNKKTTQQDSIVKYKGKVYCCTVPTEDGVVYVRRNKIPVWCGQSRHGQKGTCGILLPSSDMPFNKYGIQPDIIMSPNAVPSRMTIAQLVECLVGKVAGLTGVEADGTPFEEYDLDGVKKKLKELGYDENGEEYLYNGMTGEKMKVKIFFGPTFYQRLKHLVIDKLHSRSRGPKTLLTHQAPEGRAREGGLKMGEMERDALIAHGLSQFLLEKLMFNSDFHTTYVCDICGLIAERLNNANTQTADHRPSDDIYYCRACNNYNKISKIAIPYAFKLFIQEMMSMCIAPRIRTRKSIQNITI